MVDRVCRGAAWLQCPGANARRGHLSRGAGPPRRSRRGGPMCFRGVTPREWLVAVHYPAGPFRLPVHGERGESTGSLTRAPTVALLPFGERTVAQPAGRVSARSHARSERQRPPKGHSYEPRTHRARPRGRAGYDPGRARTRDDPCPRGPHPAQRAGARRHCVPGATRLSGGADHGTDR